MEHGVLLTERNRVFGELVSAAGPDAPVPTCPDWTVRRLAAHVGRGDRWAATIVTERAQSAVDPRTVEGGKPTDDVRGWLAEGVARLLDAVDRTGADTPVWTFLGPRPAGWWVRRRLHEVAVHGYDAARAAGAPYRLAPEVAADGVSEWLSLVAARTDRETALDEGVTLHLHATDGADDTAEGLGEAGEWMVRRTDAGVTWEHGHAKGTAAVRGAAQDLLLVLQGRLPADDERLQVLGDADVLRTWLARTPF